MLVPREKIQNPFPAPNHLRGMQETKLNFTYLGLPVEVTFQQDWTVKVPKKFQGLRKWLPLEALADLFSRQETHAKLSTPNGWTDATVRQSHKDFPSWRQGRFEALKKILQDNIFWGREFREFRKEAFASLAEMEDLW